MWVNPSKLVVKPQWLLSVATRGPNSGPTPPPTTSFWLCSAMNLLRETFWYHLQKGISLSSGIIPREGRRHCQVAPKRRKKSLTRHMRRHNFFRLSPIHLISGLSYSEVKKITMKFVNFSNYFHGFFQEPHLTCMSLSALLRTSHDWTFLCTRTRWRRRSSTNCQPLNKQRILKGNEK